MSRFKYTQEEKDKIWHLHIVEGLTYKQIAERFGKTRTAMSGLIYKEKRKRGNDH